MHCTRLELVGGISPNATALQKCKHYIQYVFRLFGYRVIRDGGPNLRDFVESDYKKFETDFDFLQFYEKCKDSTLVDVLRLYELWNLVGQTRWLEKGDYLEVGVWRGGSGALIAKKVKEVAKESTVFLADTFDGVVKASDKDSKFVGGELSNTNLNMVHDLLKKEGLLNCRILQGVFPEETGKQVSSKLRMVHVDVVTYEGTKDVVDWADDKLVNGGIIVFDDYGFTSCDGAGKFIEERYGSGEKYLFIHNINGHGIAIKR